jgi:hypothetical protein
MNGVVRPHIWIPFSQNAFSDPERRHKLGANLLWVLAARYVAI